VKITFNVKGFFDRRTTPLLEAARIVEQQRADQAIEREFRRRVRNNWKERARVQGIPRTWLSPVQNSELAMLKRQAN
jgi:hypothetical protein